MLQQLQQFGNFCLPFVVVCQLPKRYGKGKKGHLQVFGKIDLAKPKIVDPAIFAAIFFPRRIWSRAFGRACFFVAAFSSSRAASPRRSQVAAVSSCPRRCCPGNQRGLPGRRRVIPAAVDCRSSSISKVRPLPISHSCIMSIRRMNRIVHLERG